MNRFLKHGSYNKLRFYEQILKVETSIFRKFFSFSTAELTFNYKSSSIFSIKRRRIN
ncbi:hypothetical protein LEP1GSC036_4387 [Leptospira weilii str. 2006001853]|uniref:Uncharacterized protein n=3 Tax=Leptospira weilii TaxID=28184 RepID=A0A828YXH6_9LEPT|nr:hypothetical protein LEP1GSC036_4387 [Leptospira weilii str. 2006001853]EMJ66108.1 hypothetical protein LEP1GSC051_1085 [Leptospira sp. P2653]EMN46129.1 hypothetical protein LEP1GSC086_3128 [Leptospira weilii str. LNT 1234]EMN91132.1 hypothetical protein LEP1GSC108_1076 [Leptospira weilii str. UI 13098]EMY12674.1 hypothetical protein LEP1GSC043_1594 [Leptospira weilii str. Ecochallenge]